MKKIFSLCIVLLFAASAGAVENPWEMKLPFKSAMVEYELTGTMTGDKTIYVKDYGKTRAEYNNTTMKMMGMTQHQKEVIITTPDWEYTIDLMEHTGTKQANLNKYMTQEFNKLSKSDQKKVVENAEKLGVATVEGMEGTVEKNASKILGYTCDKVSMTGVVAHTISGTDLPLKTTGDIMGIKINQVATRVMKGDVHPSKFALPTNIEFEHDVQTDLMTEEQAKTIIQSLLEGKVVTHTNPSVTRQASSQPIETQPDNGLGQDAKDVGNAARQEAKDAATDEVREGVRALFKSVFN
ncbi:MAG: hypothetical protein KKC20_02230 [Proteobacteria bacterium]|nr:hypothetical protein [Pseudomonadota bacterium]